jgi:hypothetical protein
MKNAVIAQSSGRFHAHTHDTPILMTTQRLDEPNSIFAIIRDDVGVGIAMRRGRTVPMIDELGDRREISAGQTEEQGKHLHQTRDEYETSYGEKELGHLPKWRLPISDESRKLKLKTSHILRRLLTGMTPPKTFCGTV